MNLKPWINIVALLIVAAAAVIITVNILNTKTQAIEAQIDSLSAQKVQVINADSIRRVVSKQVIDSLSVVLASQDEKIAAIQKSLTITRRKNEALQKRFDDIVIFMPDF